MVTVLKVTLYFILFFFFFFFPFCLNFVLCPFYEVFGGMANIADPDQ